MTIFTQIIKNPEPENYRILELNDSYLVMLSLKPESPGHTLVIPVLESDDLTELLNVDNFFSFTLMWAQKIKEKLNAKAYTLKINNKVYQVENDGHINHLHFHIIPRYSMDDKITASDSKEELLKLKNLILK